MNNIRMAVLDSGISERLSEKCNIIGKKNFYYDHYSEEVISNDNIEDLNGHGSRCIETILTQFEKIDFYIIKMLGVSGLSNDKALFAALEYASNLDVDIITICSSICGVSKDDKLKKLCDSIASSGKLIIASVENRKLTSEPANFGSVIGVIGTETDDECFCYESDAEIQMKCSYLSRITYGSFGLQTIFQGNSRAAALASAHIAMNMYEARQNNTDLEKLLTKRSVPLTINENDTSEKTDLIRNILFDKDREEYLVENDIGYQRFLYSLCEFFLFNDPTVLRTADLINFKGRKMLRKMANFLGFIEERFEIKLADIMLEDMKWAYLFYDRHISRINVNSEEE